MLLEFGKTADEWGDLDPHVRLFHEAAQRERNRRLNDELQD